MPQLAPACPLRVLLPGCEQSPLPQPDPASAPETPAPTSETDSAGNITMRYACEGSRRVDVVHGETARTASADGCIVEISRAADSALPRYSGEALSFEVDSGDATPGGNETGGFWLGTD